MPVTKLRSSSMSWHGVFHKSRVFDPTCLFEAKVKPTIQNKAIFVLFSDYCSIFLERTLIILMISGLAPLRGARVWMPSDISEFSVVKEKEQLNGLKSLIASAYFNQKISEFSVVKKIHLRNLINLAASQQIKQAYLHSTCTSFRSFKRVRQPVINLSGLAPLRGAQVSGCPQRNIMNNE